VPAPARGPFRCHAVASALHWLTTARAGAVLRDIHRLLDDDGALMLAEPVVPLAPFAPGFGQWKARQPPRYEHGSWTAFWQRANELTGYDHTQLLGPREADRIGDRMTVRDWTGLAEAAGFRIVDVLWRDADGVIVAAQKTRS